MAKNGALNKASIAKEDEFYTKMSDIEKELKHYKEHFRDKVVFCNCDDPEASNFWKYFELNFEFLGLKKLIATHYEDSKPSYKLELIRDENEDGRVDKQDIVKTPLVQNGDFRSPECMEIMDSADIVVTNPPFSLFREYIALLLEHRKSFLVIGSQNNVTYKEIFPLLKDNKLWLGYHSGDMEFVVPDYYKPRATRYREENGIKYRSMGNICWFTNLDIEKRHESLILYRNYDEMSFPQYDEYNAINVSKVSEIPFDYEGIMGVPITFLCKHNPEQFEIVGLDRYVEDNPHYGHRFKINGKETYARILIRRRKQPHEN
ncbi:MAG: modification methylase [Lachnospiraceae bacterium]|nr:modification methylase [Lachnospiraceae bacterium]